MALAAGVVVIDAVLGNPLGRFQGFHVGMTGKSPRAAVDKGRVMGGLSILNFGILAALSPRLRAGGVLVVLSALLADKGGMQVVKAVTGNPIRGFHPSVPVACPAWRPGLPGAALLPWRTPESWPELGGGRCG